MSRNATVPSMLMIFIKAFIKAAFEDPTILLDLVCFIA